MQHQRARPRVKDFTFTLHLGHPSPASFFTIDYHLSTCSLGYYYFFCCGRGGPDRGGVGWDFVRIPAFRAMRCLPFGQSVRPHLHNGGGANPECPVLVVVVVIMPIQNRLTTFFLPCTPFRPFTGGFEYVPSQSTTAHHAHNPPLPATCCSIRAFKMILTPSLYPLNNHRQTRSASWIHLHYRRILIRYLLSRSAFDIRFTEGGSSYILR